MLSFRLAVRISSWTFSLTLTLRWWWLARWFWWMSTILADRLELATQIVARPEFGRCGLCRRYRRVLVRLEFVLRLWRGIFDGRLLRHWRFFGEWRWWCRCGHRLRRWYSFLSEFTLHLLSYIHLFKGCTLPSLLHFVIVVFIAIHENVRLQLFAV